MLETMGDGHVSFKPPPLVLLGWGLGCFKLPISHLLRGLSSSSVSLPPGTLAMEQISTEFGCKEAASLSPDSWLWGVGTSQVH